jgi:hypothetical protein
MAKVDAPLLSMGARGTIGKSVTFSSWRGIKTARQRVIPANPRTTAQQANRTRFAFLREAYKLAPAAVRAPWVAFAAGRPFTDSNKFVGENNRLLVGEVDLSAALMSPGARGGLPPAGVVAATGANAGEITVTVTPPDQLPDGWTVDSVGAAAVPQQDPVGLFVGPFVADTEANPATPMVLGGFTPGGNVAAYGWVIYEKPDGSLAYSVSVYDAAVADA